MRGMYDQRRRHPVAAKRHLRKMMLEELERCNYSKGTIRHYVRFVEPFSQHFGKSPDKLGP